MSVKNSSENNKCGKTDDKNQIIVVGLQNFPVFAFTDDYTQQVRDLGQ